MRFGRTGKLPPEKVAHSMGGSMETSHPVLHLQELEERLRVAVIGAGYWGPNLARNFRASPDWELAAMGLPQRDLAECLAFMLPERASREQISRQLEQHRGALERETGIEIRRDEWDHGFRAALCDFLVDRLASYAMVDRVRRQAFLPRVARG